MYVLKIPVNFIHTFVDQKRHKNILLTQLSKSIRIMNTCSEKDAVIVSRKSNALLSQMDESS